MMKKEEGCEKLEEEVVTLRVNFFKLKKNAQERGISTPRVKNVEENFYRLLESKNDDKAKSYVEIIRGHIKKE